MLKETYQGRIILQSLRANCVHPGAEALYTFIKEKHPKIGIATVYRNLNKMAEAGVIRKISGLDNKEHFDHNTSPHYHMICEKCGEIHDIYINMPVNLLKELTNKTKHDILSYDITFKGICKNCKGEK